jgi:hypothetical protein
VTKALRPRASTKLIRVRSRVIDSTRGLSMIRRREFPSVQALVTSISPTGRMVIELSICSVSTESRFGAVADSSSKVGSRARVRPAQWSRLVLPTDYYPVASPLAVRFLTHGSAGFIPESRTGPPGIDGHASAHLRPREVRPRASGGWTYQPPDFGDLRSPTASRRCRRR